MWCKPGRDLYVMVNQRVCNGGPNGNRTRVSGVRGQRPRPLDDGTMRGKHEALRAMSAELVVINRIGSKLRTHDSELIVWLGEEDSNPRRQSQSLPSYHWTIPQSITA